MDGDESLSHSEWECKYDVVCIPKGRRKALYGDLRKYLGEVFCKLAEQKESRIEEKHLLPDHVHISRVHPRAGGRGQALGSVEHVALKWPPAGDQEHRGRVSDPA